MKGQIFSGEFEEILLRQKAGEQISLGELLISEVGNKKALLQVYDLVYGSQMSDQKLEFISGMQMEESSSVNISDSNLRNYQVAKAKPLLSITEEGVTLCKSLPPVFTEVREVKEEDVKFLTKPDNPLFIGNLRSGKEKLDVDVYLNGEEVLKHHILIPATTGRGKSNLATVIAWNLIDKEFAGNLLLDAHDEYYGRNTPGLKDHPQSNERLKYYTANNPPAGAETLKINLKDIQPQHLKGVANWSDPQIQALYKARKELGDKWIEKTIKEEYEWMEEDFQESTLTVVRRRLTALLGLKVGKDNKIESKGVFDKTAGKTTITDICNELEKGKTVIVDTSSLGNSEILVGSIISSQLFQNYQKYKREGNLENKPVISILLEEAPRVLGKEALQKTSNIFDRIAREGRKFRIGLMAITQLPSMIPRSILANMNTKIILGLEMKQEREKIIESASQDLSSYDKTIASLDTGEAIISSNFTKFAIPTTIPLFPDDIIKEEGQKTEKKYEGIKEI